MPQHGPRSGAGLVQVSIAGPDAGHFESRLHRSQCDGAADYAASNDDKINRESFSIHQRFSKMST